jgi:hypothetical protein
MIGRIGTILGGLSLLGAFVITGIIIYGLIKQGWIALLGTGCAFAFAGIILLLIGIDSTRFNRAELAAVPGRLALAFPPAAEVVTGPVLERVNIHTWTVRKTPSGSYAALPITPDGRLLWDMAVGFDENSDGPWEIANVKRRELDWIR